jgi:predicted nucleic acid-binding protein
MPVVADAGPLIALARLGYLDLLPSLYTEIVLPPTVYREVTADPDLTGADTLAHASWLRIEPVHDRITVQRLQFWLDEGESEAITLARALQLTLLMDERRGRTIATTLGVRVTGTVGILIAAKQHGQVDLITPLLDRLRTAGVHVSQRLYDEARRMAGEQ